MNRRLAAVVMLAGGSMLAAPAVAQDLAPLDAGSARVTQSPPGQTLTPPSDENHGAIVVGFMRGRGLDAATAGSLRAAGEQAANGVSHLRLEQEVDGLTVYGTYVKASFNGSGALIHLIENVARVTPAGVLSSRIGAAQALRAALAGLYPGQSFDPVENGRSGNTTTFAAGPFFHRAPTVTAVALPMTDSVLRAGYLVETWSEAANQLNHTVVSGDGRVLFVEDRTDRDSYNVYVKDPLSGAQTVVAGPGGGNSESPIGWLGTGTQTSVNISGNNARAYLDTDANNAADAGGSTVTDGNFLAASDLSAQPSTSGNRAVAVQNLFYLNNVVHDTLYRHGFTEAAGNFQVDNFGLGGLGNDPVNAEAQDGSGLDNANFATPTDGSSPRMQMYLWSGAGPNALVTVNSSNYGAWSSAFGPAVTLAGVSGSLVVVNDGVGTTTDGCEAIPTSLKGLIAIVDRGACNFTVKVLNAQKAGAAAVIIANNVPEGGFGPGAADNSANRVRIPSAMVTQSDGSALKGLAGAAAQLRKNPVDPLLTDGDLDSDVVYHEYGHGLTWRMIGGMSGKLAGAIGEGAADVNAFLINGDDRIGEYAASSSLGIRRYPYQNYPLTYSAVTGGEVHNDGEIYAAAMWRVLQNYLAAGLTAADLQADFVGGMNFTPATPAFEDMRDGMLQNAAGSGRECLIWKGFAATGIGVGADGSVSRNGRTVTIVESFTVPPSCQ